MLIGLDIGGTKIEGVVVSSSTLEIRQRLRVVTPKTNYRDFLESVKDVIATLTVRCGGNIKSIGVGCCGSVDNSSGVMRGANILYLNGEHFLKDLQSEYPLPVSLTNDANCLAISEFRSGAAKDAASSCLAMILGTGCGGGVIINGNIVDGLHGLGGEIGHNPLPGFDIGIDGPAINCYCGSRNCVESFISGTGLERSWALYNEPTSAKQVFELYTSGNKVAIQFIEAYTDRVARTLGSIINVIDPEVIVLGGGVSNQKAIYPLIKDKLRKYTFNNVSTPVIQAHHGDSSGVLGAALLPRMKGMI